MADKIKNKKKYSKILGIEISENNIVCSEIQFDKNNINLTNGFKLNLPVFQDINKTVATIKQTLKTFNIKTKDCSIGFSMQYFKLFPIPIPETIPTEEIDSIVLQEGNVDSTKDSTVWIPLKNTKRQDQDGIPRYDVLGISLANSLVEVCNLIAKQCGLNLVSISPSFLGAAVYLDPMAVNNLTTTLWLSQIKSEFIVWSGQEPIYEHLILTPQLNEQVVQSINYIQSQIPGTQINTIMVYGPNISDINLSQLPFTLQAFGIPENLIDKGRVFERVSPDELIAPLGIALSTSNNTLYTIPNFLESIKSQKDNFKDVFKDNPSQKGQVDSKDIFLSRAITYSIIIAALSVIGYFYIQNFLIASIESNENTSKTKITFAQTRLTKLSADEKTNKILQLKFDYLSGLIDKRKPWSKIIKEVGDMTPKGLWLDRLESRNNDLNIFGRAVSVDAVANYSINLNYTSKLLENAQIIDLKKYKDDGVDLVEFQITTQLSNTNKSKTEEISTTNKEAKKI